jgi:hypothetical protein
MEAVEHRNNLVPVRMNYCSKDEKLLVLGYLPGGRLSAGATVACLLLLLYGRALNSVCQISLLTTAYPQTRNLGLLSCSPQAPVLACFYDSDTNDLQFC